MTLENREHTGLSPTKPSREAKPDPRGFFWPWGIAWFVGFTVSFLAAGPGGRSWLRLPSWAPPIILISTFICAAVTTAVIRFRTTPRDPQGFREAMAWGIAYTGVSSVLGQLVGHLTPERTSLVFTGMMVAVAATQYMVQGVTQNDRWMFGLGIWVTAANTAGMVLGLGWHALLLAVACGGGFIVAGAIQHATTKARDSELTARP